jgi:hypothetical protein
MAASGSFDPNAVPLDGTAVAIAVALYARSQPSGKRYTFLPNVLCQRVKKRAGAVPDQAQFSYILDTSDPTNPYPAYAEQLWPLGASGLGVVGIGAELVVLGFDANGNPTILFDGFADAPQVNIAGRQQLVTFTASGVAIRCWDKPIHVSIYRDASDPQNGPEIPTGLPSRFNPDGHPNCTPDNFEVNEGGNNPYPVFLDWRIRRTPDPRTFWTLGKFARYLLNTRPTGTSGDLNFVDNPRSKFLAGLDSDLQALQSTKGPSGVINTADNSTYNATDIIVDDIIAADKPWPEVLADALHRHGFEMRFRTGQDDTVQPLPEPKNDLTIYRKDGLFEPSPKALSLQASGALNPGLSNVGALSLVRDGRDVANKFRVISRPNRYEVSIVLAPGYKIDPGDANDPSQFNAPALVLASGDLRRKYRIYVGDEAGDGHWDVVAKQWVTGQTLDLSQVFGSPAKQGDPPLYVPRNRPGIDELFAKDSLGRYYLSDLQISTDYQGDMPGLWTIADGGTWQSIGRHGWELLKDRLGIRLATDKPNAWKIPDPPSGTAQVIAGGVVKGVESMASGDPPGTHGSTNLQFALKLTCVIEADWGVNASAPKRVAAPGPFSVERIVDARDVYRRDIVDPSSIHYQVPPPAQPGQPPNLGPWDRDDTDDAVSRACAYRSAYEFPPVAGPVTIPWITTAYHVGDRINQVYGRGISFQSNAAKGAGESPYFPSVVSVTWDFSGSQQRTLLELSDERSAPEPPKEHKLARGEAI